MVARVMPVGAEVVDHVRAVFGLPGSGAGTLTAAGRGAVGRLWRLEVDGRPYALKELFRPPDSELVRLETAFTSALSAAGVRLSDSLPTTDGRFVVALPHRLGGAHVRLYRWVDGSPVDPTAPGVAARLGALLGRLHANAPARPHEPDPWYDTVPPPDAWTTLVDRALAAGVGWAPGLAAVAARVPDLAAVVTPVPAERTVTCHRDLHPGNVLVDEDDELVLLDWDDVGAACTDRELGIVLVRWHVRDDGRLDTDAVRATMDAYLAAGGTGRLSDRHALTMAVACDLNFLVGQARAALDPGTTDEHREFAVREIEEVCALLPDLRLIDELLDVAGHDAGHRPRLP
jgi:Ser/Thr protein kinase RdoA (MazF antagonist)